MFNHMVNDSRAIDEVFHALSHEGRREMLDRLGKRALTVGELAEPLAISLAAASKHVKVLERAGLVHRTIEGRRHICRLDPSPLVVAASWLAGQRKFWDERLDALENLLKNRQSTELDK